MAKKEEKKYLEYKFTGKNFEYSGRIFPGKDGNGKVKREWLMGLTLNGVFAVKGVWLKQTSTGKVFLNFPQYKSGDKYMSYIFTEKEMQEDFKNLIQYLCKLLKIEAPKDDEIMEASGDDLPF